MRRPGVRIPLPPVSLFAGTYTSENADIGTRIGTHPQESNDVRYGLRHGGSHLRSSIVNDDRRKYAKFFSRPGRLLERRGLLFRDRKVSSFLRQPLPPQRFGLALDSFDQR